jgi:hypothetical protein
MQQGILNKQNNLLVFNKARHAVQSVTNERWEYN